ncbi:S8 family serine peptidase [Bacillus cereus group sp. BfR-BA-01347]|uniref:S8 family serine peptidase n=1 Tax=Bacillus cereus group sp. BfR-BA-01347 TaxID=2920310 RepID=UPI001F5AFB71|nr:S8 family serine peptidase [Bacillus cereus group sp. BfR-BA-01347]
MNIIKKIILLTLLLTICLPSYYNSNQIKAETNNSKFFLILKDSSKTVKVEEFINKNFPTIQTDVVEEIGIINLILDNPKQLKSISQTLKDKFPNLIDSFGASSKISLPKIEKKHQSKKYTFQTKFASIDAINDNSIYTNYTWNLSDVTNNYQSYKLSKGDSTTSIALLDSGIDINHPDLKHSISLSKAKSFVEGDPSLEDKMGHGTQVAGIISGNGNIKGISPKTQIIPYKVIGEKDGESKWVIQAIVQAARDGNDIINLSLGTFKSVEKNSDKATIRAYKKAIEYAESKGCVIVASAGNDSINLDEPIEKNNSDGTKDFQIYLPSSLENVITVSSSAKDNTLASYSNYGNIIDFSAPSGDYGPNFKKNFQIDFKDWIITTSPTNIEGSEIDQYLGIPTGYTLSLGTSLASPQVSATAALIISKYQEIHHHKPTAKQVIQYLKDGAIDLGNDGKDSFFGYGKINAYNSLMSIQ